MPSNAFVHGDVLCQSSAWPKYVRLLGAGQLPWNLEHGKSLETGNDYFSSEQLAVMADEREVLWQAMVASGRIPFWLARWHSVVRQTPTDAVPCYDTLHQLLGGWALAEPMPDRPLLCLAEDSLEYSAGHAWDSAEQHAAGDLRQPAHAQRATVDSAAACICQKRQLSFDVDSDCDDEEEVQSKLHPAKKHRCEASPFIGLTAEPSAAGSSEEDVTAFHAGQKRRLVPGSLMALPADREE